MPDPTPITKHRRYSKRQKATAVVSAMASSAMAAAESTGIPRTTILYWLDSPEFANLRQKTREDLAQEMGTLAHLFATKLSQRIDELEPRDLIIGLGVVTEKSQLLSGAATNRTETRALSDGLTDHELQQFRDGLDRLLAETAPESAGSVALGAGADVRE